MYKPDRNEMIIIFLTYLCKNHINKKIRREYEKHRFVDSENYDNYMKTCPTFWNAINTFDWIEGGIEEWFQYSDKWNMILRNHLNEWHLYNEV